MSEAAPSLCPGCGAAFPAVDGPTHAYMLSSPGCWRAYGDLLAREYGDPALFAAAHRLTVDAFALQHPGDPDDRRAVRSVWLHHASLLLVLEDGRPFAAGTAAMQRLAGGDFGPLEPRPTGFAVTLEHVAQASIADHPRAVRRWAEAAFQAWPHLTPVVRARLSRA